VNLNKLPSVAAISVHQAISDAEQRLMNFPLT